MLNIFGGTSRLLLILASYPHSPWGMAAGGGGRVLYGLYGKLSLYRCRAYGFILMDPLFSLDITSQESVLVSINRILHAGYI